MTTASSPIEFQFRRFGDVLVTRDQGEPVRKALVEALEEHGSVDVDLSGVEAYTPSFMDEVLGKLLELIGAQRFKNCIKLTTDQDEVRKLVNLVLSNRAARPARA